MSQSVRALVLRFCAVLAAIAFPYAAHSAVFHCGAGDVPCLITSMQTANANGKANTIHLETGAYSFTVAHNRASLVEGTALPVVTSTLTIRGSGIDATVVERATASAPMRLFSVGMTGKLTLKDLTVRGGNGRIHGGGLLNQGTLVLLRVRTQDNRSAQGGGIYSGYLAPQALVFITDSVLDDNSASNGGGALTVNAGTASILRATFADNSGDGAGAILAEPQSIVALTDSTLVGNAGSVGPPDAIQNRGVLYLTNTTVTASRHMQRVPEEGTWALSNSGVAVIVNSTIAGNSPSNGTTPRGGGLRNAGEGITLLGNTILAANAAGGFGDCAGTVLSLGHNMIENLAGCTVTLHPSDLVGNPGIEPYVNDGMPGHGHLPLAVGSPAIDAGNQGLCPPRDQLGHKRVNIPGVGTSRCDIGAVEFQDTE